MQPVAYNKRPKIFVAGDDAKISQTVSEDIDMSTNITCNPEILLGKPCISGTRLSVELVLDKLAAGQSFEELLESHPNLTRDGILAALAFARDSIKNEIVYPLAG